MIVVPIWGPAGEVPGVGELLELTRNYNWDSPLLAFKRIVLRGFGSLVQRRKGGAKSTRPGPYSFRAHRGRTGVTCGGFLIGKCI